jgi:hypothetical protein
MMLRWLVIVLLVSLGALLFAAGGVARHIYLQRKKLRLVTPAAVEPNKEIDG